MRHSMRRPVQFLMLAGGLAVLTSAPALASDPYADRVVGYTSGTLFSATYDSSAAAVGSPTRFTGEGVYPSAVTPFNPAFLNTELVAVGEGGSLTLGFDEPVVDDPANPFGLDFIFFGNSFFADSAYPGGVAGGMFGPFATTTIEVSADGLSWHQLAGASLDGFFPAAGYSDLADPYALIRGEVPSDFTKPVDPSFNAEGLSYAQIMASYAGSGGGTGLDIASSGLSSISFVRFTVTSGELLIDGLSDVAAVPAPGTLVVAGLGLALTRRRAR